VTTETRETLTLTAGVFPLVGHFAVAYLKSTSGNVMMTFAFAMMA
jgi:hypothetical protein